MCSRTSRAPRLSASGSAGLKGTHACSSSAPVTRRYSPNVHRDNESGRSSCATAWPRQRTRTVSSSAFAARKGSRARTSSSRNCRGFRRLRANASVDSANCEGELKRDGKFTERHIDVSGALTGAMVSHLDTQLLFRPSRATGEYEHLTWEVVPPQVGDGYAFVVKKLALATAEGVVSLAAAVDALRRSDARATVDIVSDPDGWSKAAGLEGLPTPAPYRPADSV